MLPVRQRLHSPGAIYIRKALRDVGFDDEIEIIPNNDAAVMYPVDRTPSQVLASLKPIQDYLEAISKIPKRTSNSETSSYSESSSTQK